VQIPGKQKLDKWLGYLLIVILLPFTRLLGIVLRRDHSARVAPSNILFIKLLGLGSLIVSTDAIQAIRRRFPEARLLLLTDANIAAGIAPFQLFDEIWQTGPDSAGFFSTFVNAARFLIRSWRLRQLWVVDLEVYSKLTTVYALLTLARNRFGFYLAPVPFRKYLNTHNVHFDQSFFLGDNYLFMAQAVTGVNDEAVTGVRAQTEAGVKAQTTAAIGDGHESLPAQRRDEHEKPYIILNNTCSGLATVRKLPDPVFSEICRWVLGHTSYKLALLGAPQDKEEIDRFLGNDPVLSGQMDRILNFAGEAADAGTTAAGFASYYRFLEEKGVCLVTIDSGPLHIAKKLGLPTLSIWGPTDPANYLKVHPHEQKRHLSYYLAAPCSPCVHRHEKLPCGGDNFCMKNIGADAIIGKLQSLLGYLLSPHPT